MYLLCLIVASQPLQPEVFRQNEVPAAMHWIKQFCPLLPAISRRIFPIALFRGLGGFSSKVVYLA